MGLLGSLNDAVPSVHPEAWIAPGAVVVGRVSIGRAASIWYGAVLRADDDEIVVGPGVQHPGSVLPARGRRRAGRA